MRTLWIFTLLFFGGTLTQAQVMTTALPFLSITPSPEENGRGGIGTCVISTDPYAMMMNPGQLGVQSLDGYFRGGTYTSKTQWLPVFNLGDITYRADAASVGMRVNDFLSLPFGLSIGLGYSDVFLNLGQFATTTTDPNVLTTFTALEKSYGYTVGVGIDYGVRAGAGVTMKKFRSDLGVASASGTATDYGLLMNVPVATIVPSLNSVIPGLTTHCDLNAGLGRSNMGDGVSFIDVSQTDPLPRNAYIGLALDAGVETRYFGSRWRLLNFTFARQGENLLIARDITGTWSYLSGFGHLNFTRNIIAGLASDKIEIRRGIEVRAIELFTYRSGSFEGNGFGVVHTKGFDLHLRGLVRIAQSIIGESLQNGLVGFLLDHIDVAYVQSSYVSTDSPISGTKFSGITIVFN